MRIRRSDIPAAIVGMCAVVFMVLMAWQSAKAQDDIIIRPSAAMVPWGAEIGPKISEAQTVPVQVCLVTCVHAAESGPSPGYVQPSNRFRCVAVPAPSFGIVVTGEVANPYGAGNLCVRGITVASDGAVSLPSSNSITVEDLPPTPILWNPGPSENQ